MDLKKFTCNYSCNHYFGCNTIMAKNREDAKVGLKLKIETAHLNPKPEWRNVDKIVKEKCGNCKLTMKIKEI